MRSQVEMSDGEALYSVDDVLGMFPPSAKPTKSRLEDFLEEHGCYRDVFGKKMLTGEDFRELLGLMRATPTSTDAQAKLGAGRLLTMRPPMSQPGYMVIIGDRRNGEDQLYVGWAPTNGPGDLLRLVQFGNPGYLDILHFFPATPAEVMAYKQVIMPYRLRPDTDSWFGRCPPVNEWIDRMIQGMYGVDEDDEDELETEGD